MRRFFLALVIVILALTSHEAAQVRTGTISTATTCPGVGCVIFTTDGLGSMGIQIQGTFNMTLVFEQTIDDTNWIAWNVSTAGSGTVTSTLVNNGAFGSIFSAPVTALRVRVRASVFTSGSATLTAISTISRGAGGGGASGAVSSPIALAEFTTSTGNSGAGLTTVYTYNLPAGFLANNGDRLEFEARADCAANATNKLSGVSFGAATVAAISGVPSNNLVRIHKATLIRTGAATQISGGVSTESGGVNIVNNSAGTETLSGVVAITFVLQGGVNNDIVAKYMWIKYWPAGTYTP
jgi:hypothetical protein